MKNCGIKSENLIRPITNESDIYDEKWWFSPKENARTS